MGPVARWLTATPARPVLPPDEAGRTAEQLAHLTNLHLYARSVCVREGILLALGRRGRDKFVVVVGRSETSAQRLAGFDGCTHPADDQGVGLTVLIGPTHAANAARLRAHLPSLVPRLWGPVGRSFGAGDRLGLATPGHVRAVRGSGLCPFFAQQSMREMARTRRTPQQVMDEALWGVFEEGWHDGFGSDADHLKHLEDVDVCAAAGFTLFTIDPGDHVDNAAAHDPPEVLARKFESLPWPLLECSPQDWLRTGVGGRVPLASGAHVLTEDEVRRTAVKYGRAISHTAQMFRRVEEKTAGRPFELEVSVDETHTPTSPAEHFLIARHLQRLGVRWVSLAPRLVGRFEKGVDYQGDPRDLEQALADHAAVCRRLGPYKLSLHSGSDKFSVYPILARTAGELVHVKTAGTSYLEALRAVARIDPGLFREILEFARTRYEEDRASYHVSADLSRVPPAERLRDDQLPAVLDQFDARQMLHVTYGSVLQAQAADGRPRFYDRLIQALKDNEEWHYETLQRHLKRHLEPLTG